MMTGPESPPFSQPLRESSASPTFTFLGFAIVLLAGVVAKLEQRWPRAVLVFVALAILMATYLAPVWGEFPLTEQEANRRLIFLPWRP